MTLEEFAATNPDLKFVFLSYYKYTFTFRCTTRDNTFGYIDANDIYRLVIKADEELSVIDMNKICDDGRWYE